MATSVELFYYDLPRKYIAQTSVEPRDYSRLLVLNRASGAMEHRHFYDLPKFLRAGDVLVFNKTKVFKARLQAIVGEKSVELFLLRGEDVDRGSIWNALAKPGRALRVGAELHVGEVAMKVLEKHNDGTIRITIPLSVQKVIIFANTHGQVPLPPYITKPSSLEHYQTVYAKEIGSVAAPTAGFHFTKKLLQQLKDQGIEQEFVTLHVGLETFQPMKTATLEEHHMHSEYVEVDAETASRLNRAKEEGRRIIAVGTTTVRTLEFVGYPLRAYAGDVNLFITPGYTFKVVDALITNFHLPKSTLLVLVSTFAGRARILAAYEQAKQCEYRFFSFGDAMLIL